LAYLLAYSLFCQAEKQDANKMRKTAPKPLNDTFLRGLKPTGREEKYSDGGGLFILLTAAGGLLWRMAYRFAGK
jgi:hypothetical protein